jgi:hypothetical protein
MSGLLSQGGSRVRGVDPALLEGTAVATARLLTAVTVKL